MKTITDLVKRRERLIIRFGKQGISDLAEENLLTDIEALNWKIAHSHANDLGEVLFKAELLADLSGGVYPHTIEGALLNSLIDDLEELLS